MFVGFQKLPLIMIELGIKIPISSRWWNSQLLYITWSPHRGQRHFMDEFWSAKDMRSYIPRLAPPPLLTKAKAGVLCQQFLQLELFSISHHRRSPHRAGCSRRHANFQSLSNTCSSAQVFHGGHNKSCWTVEATCSKTSLRIVVVGQLLHFNQKKAPARTYGGKARCLGMAPKVPDGGGQWMWW